MVRQVAKGNNNSIPEDWRRVPLVDLAKNNGLVRGPFGGALKKEFFVRDGYKVYEQKNAIYSSVELGEYFIDDRKFRELRRFEIEEGDFIISCSGTIGKIYKIPKGHPKGIINQALLKITVDDSVIHHDYFYYQFSSDEFQKKVIDDTQGGAMKNLIGMSEFKKAIIPLPPTLDEQQKIAQALSDIDDLIQSLDKLIAKKKAIKQGAMQRLLTPKDDWKTKPLKELARYRRGSFPQPYGLAKWYDDISGAPFVQVVDVDKNMLLKPETKRKISEEGAAHSVFVKKGSVVLTIQGSIGRICITQYDSYVDRTLLIFESFLEDFNKYFFMLSVFLCFEIEKQKAPGGIIKTITKEALSSFEISYPEIDEQDRIAGILKSLSSEIELLESKREKFQLIKQGMMQELLTGKTRLI